MSYNLQNLKGSKASSGTFAEDEIVMPQMTRGLLPGLVQVTIELVIAAGTEPMVADADYFKWHLSTKSQDAILNVSDPDCIVKDEMFFDLAGAAFKTMQKYVWTYQFAAPVLISSAKLYLGVKSAQSSTVHYEIGFVPRPARGVVQQNNLVGNVQY